MVKIFFFWRLNMIGKKIKKERQENVWFFEKLNIMCSDTSKNIFDKFMIGRNSESKKMNKNKKHNTNRKNIQNV